MKITMRTFLITALAIFSFSAFAQNQKQPSSREAQQNEAFGGYIVDRFIDKNGKEVIGVSFPGKPPDNYRAPAAKPTASAITIANVPAYEWSFGCTATSAAMITGYYDNLGYTNLYTGPTNNGVAPMTNSVWGHVTINGESRALCPIAATKKGLDGRTTNGHVDDYWIKYSNCDNDPYLTGSWTQHTYESCTADYMKTNQSAFSNCDGSTTLYYYSSGDPYSGNESKDGAYGFQLFLESRGYTVTERYNQIILGYNGATGGFTFADYKREIDNGSPVFINVKGHTMVGVGYDDATQKVYLHDTWDYKTHEMTWGGSYSNMQHWGVSVFHLAPIPFTIAASVLPLNSGLVNGIGTYNAGQTAQLTASPKAGYKFLNWTENGFSVSNFATYSFTVTSNRTLVANFAPLATFTFLAQPGGQSLYSGINYNIAWQSANAQNINLDFSSDNGTNWNNIVSNYPAVSSTYQWTIPTVISSNCILRISDASTPSSFTLSGSFSLLGALKTPEQTSPANYSVGVATPAVLNWKSVPFVSKYAVEIAKDTLFTSMVLRDTSVTDTVKTISGLSANTNYYWRIASVYSGITSAKSSVWSFRTQSAAAANSISGYLVYANPQNLPMTGVKVLLTKNSAAIDSVVTDSTGSFLFKNVASGVYSLIPVISQFQWGGVSSTDALLLRRYIAGLTTFDTLQIKAADVNASGSLNSTDALLIRKRISGDISSFTIPDWIYENPFINFTGTGTAVTIRVLCAGDVNGSFIQTFLTAPPLSGEIKSVVK